MTTSPLPSTATALCVAASSLVLLYQAYSYLNRRDNDTDSKRRRRRGEEVDENDKMVGPRGKAARQPVLPYLGAFLTCLEDQCDAETHKEGHIALCVAENKLVLDLMAERFMQGAASTGFGDSSVFCYSTMTGLPVAREAAAYFLARRFLWPKLQPPSQSSPPVADQALRDIQPKHIALGAGCAALINHTFYLIGNPETKDCCLIPRPYYAAFENDMRLIAGITPFGVAQTNPAAGPTPYDLQVAHDAARKQGLNPKFLLLTNPNNPLGTIYSAATIKAAIDWARGHNMHIVVDEIYALSVHHVDETEFQQQSSSSPPPRFESVISILNNQLSHDVHVLWAVSKDFGASGLRCGLVYSQNKPFLEGLQTISIFTCVSGPIQYMIAELLTDDVFVDYFLKESSKRLKASYQICAAKLHEMVLPFVPAQAGLFVYVDFSSLLPTASFVWEQVLTQVLFRQARVVLTPGESQRDTRPGMFRICYAWVTPEVLEIAMERLSKLVSKLRRLGLEDWEELRTVYGGTNSDKNDGSKKLSSKPATKFRNGGSMIANSNNNPATLTTSTKSLTVSAPGKLLLAGGYLVLESPNPGVVVGVDKRFYCSIQVDQEKGSSVEKNVAVIPITVSSPQFGQEWKYEYHSATAQLMANPKNTSMNGFVEKTLRVSLLCLLHNKTTTTMVKSIQLTIRGDNDFYSLVPHLKKSNLPINLSGALQLPPFLQAAKDDNGKILKTGLGSSACLVTSVVAALVYTLLNDAAAAAEPKGNDKMNSMRDVIFRLAQICHCHAQGKVGSGFDVASACYGSHIYERFPKEILADLLVQLEEETTTTALLHDQLNAKVFTTTWPGGLQAPLQLPPFLQVMLADVSGGSESPSMARTVLAWKKNAGSAATTAVPHWDDLARLNPRVGELWQQLMTVATPTEEELKQLANTAAKEWNSSDDTTNSSCRNILYQLHQTLAETRHHLKAMGNAAKVPVEPEEQTALANATCELPGVVAALVPGAGGYDALACIYINTDEVRHRISGLWSEWGGKDGSTQVCPLTVQGINFGEGVRLEP